MTVAFPQEAARPLYAEAIASMKRGDLASAERLMRQSLETEGASALSHHYLAHMLAALPDRVEEAIAQQRRAAALAPDHPVFCAALGLRLQDVGEDREALYHLERALSLDPACALALPWALRLRRRFLRWQDEAQERDSLAALLASGHAVDPLMLLSYIDDPAIQLENARRMAPKLTPAPLEPHPPHDRIRIGYFSADFGEHATMHLMEGLFRCHDKARFAFYVYDFRPQVQSRQHRFIRDFADVYRDVRAMSSAETAALARQDQLDIAVDLKGMTFDSRPEIFARRVAPVQISFIGFPGSSGIAQMDYLIADAVTVPEGAERHYSETILRMPACYQPNDNGRPLPATRSLRAAFGLPEDRFIFANFNHPHKVGPQEMGVWMEILRQVPEAVLLFYTGKNDLSPELARHARSGGVDPNRIIACGPLPQSAHLDRVAQVDLCLDCFAYNAHTTASDALWAGVPHLTLCGDQFAARVATSILAAGGVPELSVHTREDFVSTAVALARDPARLQHLRQRVVDNREGSALFDTQSWTRQYEALLSAVHAS